MKDRNVSVKLIIDKIKRHPMLQDIPLETIVDYTVDFMRIVGAPALMEEKVATLHIKDYKALLPCDLYQIIQIRSGNIYYRSSTDTFHYSNDKEARKNYAETFTYKVQGGVIYFSNKEGEVEISYSALATDEHGYPVVPDNSSFFRAIVAYIKKEWFTILFDLGKLHGNVLQNAQQEYAWAVGDCESETHRMTLDEAESFYNSWRTLLVRSNEHDHGFIHNGSKELLKKH